MFSFYNASHCYMYIGLILRALQRQFSVAQKCSYQVTLTQFKKKEGYVNTELCRKHIQKYVENSKNITKQTCTMA